MTPTTRVITPQPEDQEGSVLESGRFQSRSKESATAATAHSEGAAAPASGATESREARRSGGDANGPNVSSLSRSVVDPPRQETTDPDWPAPLEAPAVRGLVGAFI